MLKLTKVKVCWKFLRSKTCDFSKNDFWPPDRFFSENLKNLFLWYKKIYIFLV